MHGTETTDGAPWEREGWIVRPYHVPVLVVEPPGALSDLRDPEHSVADEDRLDIEAAVAALTESSSRIPYEDVRRELGLA